MDRVLLLGLALAGGATLAVSPGWSAAAAVGVALAVAAGARRGARRKPPPRWPLALAWLTFAIGGLRAASAIRDARATYAASVAWLKPPTRCYGPARVVASPIVLVRPGAEDVLGDARVDVELEAGSTCGDATLTRPIRARVYGAPRELARGDHVEIVADLAPVYLFENVELASPWPAIARSGVAASGGAVHAEIVRRAWGPLAWIDRARASVRRRIEATFSADAAPLARALVLGEADLAPEDDDAFRKSGLAHLLAVSGTHLVVAVLGVAGALRAIALRIPRLAARGDPARAVAWMMIAPTWAYADFAGGSGSAIRAAAMLTAVLFAQGIGRRSRPARSLGWALLGCAVVDPLVIFDASFVLSASATAGLFALGPGIAKAIVRGPKPVRALLTPVAATLAATIACAPFLALLAPTLPVLGVAANIVAAPIGELAALPICLLHATLALFPAAERGAATLGSGALLAVRFIARTTTATGLVVDVPPPTAGELAALAVGVAWIAIGARRRASAALLTALAIAALEIGARRAGRPTGELRVTVLDVGQGDALLVDLPDGELLMVDGGGFVGSPIDTGLRVVLPVLRARRRSRVDVVVLSHPHPDHFGGLASSLPALDVGELWDTGQGEADGAGATYAAMLAGLRARGVPIRRPKDVCGARDLGGARVEVLAPCPSVEPDTGANDNSFVLRVSLKQQAILLVGDAERGEEQRLLDAGAVLSATFLKVGHHGSKTSSSADFLAAVRPTFAAISTGVRNRFGHPNPIAMASLAASRAAILRTDQGGAIVFRTDGVTSKVQRP